MAEYVHVYVNVLLDYSVSYKTWSYIDCMCVYNNNKISTVYSSMLCMCTCIFDVRCGRKVFANLFSDAPNFPLSSCSCTDKKACLQDELCPYCRAVATVKEGLGF